jgi:hypothetical protein
MGKYEVRLHLAGTEVFLKAGTSQIVQPQITHIVVFEQKVTIYFDQEWPLTSKPELCLQQIDGKSFFSEPIRTNLNSAVCALELSQGTIQVLAQRYKTNAVEITKPEEEVTQVTQAP